MKKFICLILSLLLIVSLSGCGNSENTDSMFLQKITMVKMSSPPKSKTTDSINTVNRITNVLAKIEKEPIAKEDINGGWQYMIKLEIDGTVFTYKVGEIFTDSDKKQYHVTNFDDIKAELTEIYHNIDAQEVDYQ